MRSGKPLEGLVVPSDWKTVAIDDIKAPSPNAISMGPFGSDIKTDNFVRAGVPVIRGMNLNLLNGTIRLRY
jgi:type I restriction enzyme, S subunit